MPRFSSVSESGGPSPPTGHGPAIVVSREGSVAVVRFNAPSTANAWTLDLQLAYTDALQRCANDDGVAAVVVTGAGQHFCAGADMSLLDGLQRGEAPPVELRPESFLRHLDFPKPLIAAVNGTAAGMGLIHALMCDVRILADDASLTTVFARMGLVAEHGASWFLSQLAGRGAATELLLSGRRVSANEAVQMGLANRMVSSDDLLATSIHYAHTAIADGHRPDWSSIRRHAFTVREAASAPI